MVNLFTKNRCFNVFFILFSFLAMSLNGAILNESFEGDWPPENWTIINDGDANGWFKGATANTGSACAQITYSNQAHDDWLITPALNPTADNHILSLWSKNNSTSWLDQFNVMLSTTNTDKTSFTITLDSNVEPGTTYTEYTYDLTDYIGQTVYVAFQAISTDKYYLYLDDVTGVDLYVADYGLTMNTPDNAQSSAGSTYTYEVEITNSGANADSYNLEILGDAWTYHLYEHGTTNTISTISANPDETVSFDVAVVIPSEGISNGDTDDVLVSVTSQGDNSVSEDAILTTTALVPITSLTEGFESVTELPQYWNAVNTTSYSTASAVTVYNSSYSAHGGAKSLKMTNSSSTTGFLGAATPFFEAGSYDVHFFAYNAYFTCSFGYMTDLSDVNTYVELEEIPSGGYSYQEIIGSYTLPSDAYFVFKHGLGGTYKTLYIDDITIEQPSEEPLLVVAQETIDFADTGINSESENEEVIFTNDGLADLSVSDISISGTNADEFEIVETLSFPISLENGDLSSFNVKFTPTTAGEKSATLTITSDGGNEEIALTGTALGNGTIAGTVTDSDSSEPIEGVTVEANGTSTTTAANGTYSLTIMEGTHTVEFSKAGYQSATENNVVVTADAETSVDKSIVNTIKTPPYTEDFTTYLPIFWTEKTGQLGETTTFTNESSSAWLQADYLNDSSNSKGAKLNIWSTGKYEWIITPTIDLGSARTRNSYRLTFDYGVTNFGNNTTDSMGADDKVCVVISTDAGETWSNANTLMEINEGNQPDNNGTSTSIDLSAYSGLIKIGFYAESTVNNTDYDFHIDNVAILENSNTPLLSVNTNEIDFSDTGITLESDSSTITFSNDGLATLSVSDISISGTNADEFEIVESLSYPISLENGNSSTVNVKFTPTTAGEKSATLTITSDGGTEEIALTGTALGNGTIAGTVTDTDSSEPIEGVTVEANGTSTTTAVDGTYSLTIMEGTYTVNFSKENYVSAISYSVAVTADAETTLDKSLVNTIKTPPYLEEFASFPPTFWTEKQGTLTENTEFSYDYAAWSGTNFANISYSNKGASIYVSSTGIDEWLITPTIDLSSRRTTYKMKFKTAITNWSTSTVQMGDDDAINVVISTDNGATWSNTNILRTFTSADQPTATPEEISIDLSAYSGLIKIGFYAESTVSNASYYFHIDDVSFEENILTPVLVANPSEIDFADTGITLESAPSTITFSNDGLATLSVSDISLSGTNADQFAIVEDLSYPISLENGNSSTVNVKFTPTTAGEKSATLTITSDGGTEEIALTGTALGNGTIAGTITDSETNNPVAGVTISAGNESTTTAQNGTYSLTIMEGSYTVNYDKFGHASQTIYSVVVAPNEETTKDISFVNQIAELPYEQDFSSTTFVPENWEEKKGLLSEVTDLVGTSADWNRGAFANTGENYGAKVNIYGTSKKEWIFTPYFTIPSSRTSATLSVDMALTAWNNNNATTMGEDDKIAILVSNDDTWGTNDVVHELTFASETQLTNEAQTIEVDLSSYSGTIRIAFYGESTVSNEDNDLHIDNIAVTIGQQDVTEDQDVPENDQSPNNFPNTGVVVQFTEDHPGTVLDVTASFETPTTVGELPNGVQTIASNYWTIISSAGNIGTYDITFDLSEMPGIQNFESLRFLKREDASSPWLDVVLDLGATLEYNFPFITIRGLDGFSQFVPASNGDNTLPVELTSFTGVETESHFAQINWETASEANLLGYNIYRSNNDVFENSMKLNNSALVANNQTTTQSYCFTDEEVIGNNTYYYWLESVEYDDSSDLFGPISIEIKEQEDNTPELPKETMLAQAYPNPFNPSTTISFNVKEGESGQLSIFNIRGQLVLKKEFEAGQHMFVWNAENNGSGVYFYKLQSDSYSKVRKVMMMK